MTKELKYGESIIDKGNGCSCVFFAIYLMWAILVSSTYA